MKAEFINPFVSAAMQVLQSESKVTAKKGLVAIQESPLASDDLTVLIGVTGRVQGLVLYNMNEKTAKAIVAAMTGEAVPVFDKMTESAVAELGNVITGVASGELEVAGYPCTIAPPSVISGRGVMISTLSIQRLVIPLEMEGIGSVQIHVALRETY
ncbi:MAG: chemotaxis protein CheX [Symbiobacteriia bacterium]